MRDPEIGHRSATVTQLHRRRQLRREMTDAEARLWQLLRGRQLAGERFRRQHQIGPYVVDFYCASRKITIEADGGQHLSAEGLARDTQRTRYLEERGVTVLRFSDREILLETEGVLEAIARAVRGRMPDHGSLGSSP